MFVLQTVSTMDDKYPVFTEDGRNVYQISAGEANTSLFGTE